MQVHGGAAYPANVHPLGNARYHCYLDGPITKEYKRAGGVARVYSAGVEGTTFVESATGVRALPPPPGPEAKKRNKIP